MSFTIRPFTMDDCEQLAPVVSAVYEVTITPEAIRWDVEHVDPKIKYQDWVAEVNGRIVATGRYGQHLGAYHPRKFNVDVAVLPDYRRRGIGGALYDTVVAALQEHAPISLSTGVREDRSDSVRFAEKRGFTETMRTWESHYDLTTPEPAHYDELLARVEDEGYEIHSYADLAADPERDQKLYELVMEVRRDVPTPEAMTDITFEQWSKGLAHPHFYGGGYFIAIKGGEWVGLSMLRKTDDDGVLNTGLTAIKRAHRGTGIAKALKLKAIRRAKADGYKRIKTWNESNNVRMLSINQELGFVRKPAWVSYRLQLENE